VRLAGTFAALYPAVMSDTSRTTLPARSDVDPQFTWNLQSLFPSEEAYLEEFDKAAAEIEFLTQQRGQLDKDGATLFSFLERYWAAGAQLRRLRLYAQMPVSADSTDQAARQRAGRFGSLAARWSAATAFVEPEILALGKERLAELTAGEPRLEVYARYFSRLEAQRSHVRSFEVEEVLGGLGEPFSGASQAYGSLVNSDMRFQGVRLPGGEEADLAPSTLPRLISHPDRDVRRQAFSNYADSFLAYRNTITDLYLTRVKSSAFLARSRAYPSTVEEALSPREVPRAALDAILRVFQRRLPVWHRYWAARRRLLGVEQLEPWDVFAPLGNEPLQVPYEQATEWILEGLAPLGSDYVARVRSGLTTERWVDVYPNRGKRDGAFAAGAPGAQPFIMMSYDGGTGGMSTLAHELGHAMHAQLTFATQPLAYSAYSMVVAETASNLNQALLFPHLLDNNADPQFQLAVIEEALYNLHRYFFIMPTLARFELAVHGAVERGEGLTADRLNEIMRDLFAEGYGSEMQVDDQTGITWAQFAHLYVPFYTFQYASGISAASALAADLRSGKEGARERVLEFLSSGDLRTPLETLQRAGVDLTTDEPIERAFDAVEEYVSRLEALADAA
jgi:oligoendopeptidase F